MGIDDDEGGEESSLGRFDQSKRDTCRRMAKVHNVCCTYDFDTTKFVPQILLQMVLILYLCTNVFNARRQYTYSARNIHFVMNVSMCTAAHQNDALLEAQLVKAV